MSTRPAGAEHVAWQEGPDWPKVIRSLPPRWRGWSRATWRPVLLICRSGNRSVDAGLALEAAGFTCRFNVAGRGLEGPLDDDAARRWLAFPAGSFVVPDVGAGGGGRRCRRSLTPFHQPCRAPASGSSPA